jgi:hypothetical protein
LKKSFQGGLLQLVQEKPLILQHFSKLNSRD